MPDSAVVFGGISAHLLEFSAVEIQNTAGKSAALATHARGGWLCFSGSHFCHALGMHCQCRLQLECMFSTMQPFCFSFPVSNGFQFRGQLSTHIETSCVGRRMLQKDTAFFHGVPQKGMISAWPKCCVVQSPKALIISMVC